MDKVGWMLADGMKDIVGMDKVGWLLEGGRLKEEQVGWLFEGVMKSAGLLSVVAQVFDVIEIKTEDR